MAKARKLEAAGNRERQPYAIPDVVPVLRASKTLTTA
jgi:hypothetical protein